MLENGSNFYMPVAPANNGSFGGFGGDSWAWIILLLLLGWGNNGYGNGFGGNDIYPWMNQSNQINGGFRDQFLNDNIISIRDGVNGLSTQLCNGFANAEIAANSRQMADMNQTFALQSALQNCCCENRAGIADLKYTVATENCADRTQSIQNARDIIENQTRNTQAILDKLCQQEIDALKTQNVSLQNQLNMATLRESQTAQTSQILADNSRQTTALEQYLNPVPIPAYVVQNPNCCTQTYCGCGA